MEDSHSSAGREPHVGPPVASRPTTAEELGALAGVVDNLHESVCITTTDLDTGPTIVFVNEAFTKLTGYLPEEVIGKTPRILQGPKTSRAELDRLKRDLRAGRTFSGTTVNYRRDGAEFLMAWYALPLRDADGRVHHFLAVQRDATQERSREAMAMLFLSAFDHTSDAIALLDERGRVLHANRACVAMVGAPHGDLIGVSVRATGLVPKRVRLYREIVTALAEHGEWHGEFETSGRRSEPRRIAVSVTRVPTLEPEARFVVDAHDVTHQRRLEYIADATNLVENVGYVFAGLRHELGNPINSIKTALTVVRENLWTLPRNRVEDYLDRVLQEVARVEYLLRSLQSFNATHKPVLEAVPIGAFLARFVTMIQPDVERRGVALACDVDDECGSAIADPRALHQVLLNLLTNALDALTATAAPRIRISARRRGAHLILVIVDNGVGIAPERRTHVFDPFHTTKHKGTGLGLAITRKLVTLMRGTVELEPPGGGETVFAVTLDAAEAAEAARTRSTTRPPPLQVIS
jgi:PAS domain S-box-containing protein